MQDVLDAIPEEVALLDDSGVIAMTNAAWRSFAEEGDSPEPLGPGADYLAACEGAPWSEGLSEVGPALRELFAGTRDSFLIEYPYHSPTQKRHFTLHAERLPGGVLLIHKDVTLMRSSGVEAATSTNVDALTRVLNRYGLAVRLTGEIALARTRGQPLSAVVVNCDELRAINSHHGMLLGDIALVEVARRLRDSVRPDDAVARIGNDEFVVLLRGQDLQVATQVAERIRLAVGQRPISESHGPVKLTVSVAVAPVEPCTESIDSLLRELDSAMRKSKQMGRNRVSITGQIAAIASPEREQRARVNEAMGQLRVAAQDLVQLDSGEHVGVELLVRGPRGQLESPVDLFRTAFECDLLGSLDEACLRACLGQAHRFGAADVHINVYPRTLLALWPEHILQWLAASAQPERICFELCEQQIVGHPRYLVERLRALRALGFRIAVDDVGFGNSCLESLIVLEPDIVKIDRSFVTGASAQPELAKNLERILRVTKALGAMSVVEGVEQVADAQLALSMGADCGQGYLWSRPRLVQ